MHLRRDTLFGFACLLLVTAGGVRAQAGFGPVLAIFEERCTLCHAGPAAPMGLRLDGYEQVMTGSDNGPVVVAGDPEASELVARIRGTSLPRMPLTGPPFLDDAEIDLITDWVEAGAPGPEATRAAGGAVELPGAEPAGAADEPVGAEAAGGADDPVRASQPQESAAFEGPPDYSDVEAILVGRCAKCHSDGGLMGAAPEGVRLTSYELTMQGGERAVVVPFSPLASELYRKVVGHSLPRMPLDGPPYLDSEQIELIAEWIEQGARDPAGGPATVPAGAEVRLRGTLTGRWELDGLELLVGPSARIDDEPGQGDYVEVRGVVTPEGRIRVERLRPR